MNDSTDLAMTMRDRAGWTGTDPIVSVLLINGAKALEEAEREVAELREAAKRVLNAHLRDPNYFLDHEVTAARIEYNESRTALERLIYAPPAQGNGSGA